jgi:hypothetical protein
MRTPLPGSEDHQTLWKQGAWMDGDLNKYDLHHRVVHHPRMSDAEYEQIYRDTWKTYYTLTSDSAHHAKKKLPLAFPCPAALRVQNTALASSRGTPHSLRGGNATSGIGSARHPSRRREGRVQCAILNSGKQRQQIPSAVEAGHRAAGELAGSALGGDSPAEDRPAYLAAAEACRRQEAIERWLAAR